MSTKYLDENGLLYFWGKIKSYVAGHCGVTDVKYDASSKKIQQQKNGGSYENVVTLATVATSGSYNDLSNKPTIPSGVSPYDSNPAMDGTASPGSSNLFARGDHVHPTDTSRAANTDFVGSRFGVQPGTHGLVPAPPAKTGDAIGSKYFLLDDGYWHGGWMDLYFDSSIGEEGEYVLRVRYMQSDGQTQATLWSTTLPAVTSTTRGMMRASDKVNLDTLWNSGDYQSDWSQSDSTAADYIKNKPTIPTVPGDFTGATSSAAGAHGLVPAPGSGEQKSLLWGNGTWDEIAMSFGRNASDGLYLNWYGAGDLTNRISWTKVPDATTSLPGAMSASDKTKLDSIATGAEVNVQSNWNQTTTTADDYIKNKPVLGTAAAKTVGAASGNLQENGSALSASKAVVTDANKKFVSSSYSLGSACAKTVGASSGNLQENGAALSASKAVVTDANKKFVSSSYTLGAACEKSIGSVADGNTGLVTGDAVYDAIQSAISGITGISFNSSYTSVSDLPATGTAGVIYLIPNSGSNPNSYDEYVWVGSSYEKLGTTDVDLTGYLNTTNHVAITNAEIDTICV